LKKIFEKLLRQTITNNTRIPSKWDEYFNRIRVQLEYELKSGNLLNVQLGAAQEVTILYMNIGPENGI
jgi:hypothetical protein